MNINDILDSGRQDGDIIDDLKQKSFDIISWSALVRDYDPNLHRIMHDGGRRDKVRQDGSVERAARITANWEQLAVNRYTEFTFGLPVKRIYKNIEGDETKEAIASAIEAIYKNAHIDAENVRRGHAYYAACEFATSWYVTERQNNLYGFPSKYKLRCRTYSPMDGVDLYPLVDELGDMWAMSFHYYRPVKENKRVEFFETYTADRHIRWMYDGEWRRIEDVRTDSIGKIPCVYQWRRFPVWHGKTQVREEYEYAESRLCDTNAYNASPVLKVTGAIVGDEPKGETRRLFRMEEGGDVEYVSWDQQVAAIELQLKTLRNQFFASCQMPDLSFDNMAGLGNIGYDARQTLFMDAHLKIGEEKGRLLEALEREGNIIKAFLKLMNAQWANAIDDIEIEHVITPFIQNDKSADADLLLKLNGGKPVKSQLESIREAGSRDPQATLEQIQAEEAAERSQRNSVFDESYS